MSKELCEIIEYVQENYKEEYTNILYNLKSVHKQMNQTIKKCVDEGDYSRINELSIWAAKFNAIGLNDITLEIHENISNSIDEKSKMVPHFDGIELSLSDKWTSYIPIGFVFGGASERIFRNWKSVYTGILKELFRKDYKSFEKMVNDNKIQSRQSQKPLFSQRKINSEYAEIPNTGYFYRSYGLSPEQMKSNLQRIFEYFGIEKDSLTVFVDANTKRKPKTVKSDIKSGKIEIAYIIAHEVLRGEKCPLCSEKMDKYKLKFKHDDGVKIDDNELHSMICSKCNKIYISDKVHRNYIKGKNPDKLSVIFKKYV